MGIEENKVQNEILSYMAWCGIFCWRNNSTGVFDPKKNVFRRARSRFSINGVADILAVHKGKFIAVECKSKNGKATPDQKLFLDNIKQRGGIGMVARSFDEVLIVLALEFPDDSKIQNLYNTRIAPKTIDAARNQKED